MYVMFWDDILRLGEGLRLKCLPLLPVSFASFHPVVLTFFIALVTDVWKSAYNIGR